MKRIATAAPLAVRTKTGHKGLFGRVLIVGGSEGMIGAPVFAGSAALRMGSGLVQIAVPRAILPFALSITPELIGLGLDGKSSTDLLTAAESADAIVVGPGMGKSVDAMNHLMQLIRINKPMVIDADALNMLATKNRWLPTFKAQAVLAPHPGEMARLNKLFGAKTVLSDDKGRAKLAASAASAFGQVIVLKGDRTIVTDGKRIYLNKTGNSALSKAGTGDVLSGMIGSLMGQGMDCFDAACAAVRLHGIAGEIAGKRLGLRSPLARDVIEAIPEVLTTESVNH